MINFLETFQLSIIHFILLLLILNNHHYPACSVAIVCIYLTVNQHGLRKTSTVHLWWYPTNKSMLIIICIDLFDFHLHVYCPVNAWVTFLRLTQVLNTNISELSSYMINPGWPWLSSGNFGTFITFLKSCQIQNQREHTMQNLEPKHWIQNLRPVAGCPSVEWCIMIIEKQFHNLLINTRVIILFGFPYFRVGLNWINWVLNHRRC